MGALLQPRPAPAPTQRRPELAVVAGSRGSDLHLFTYLVGNGLAWVLWAAISVSADPWYWWVIVPLVGWTLVLVLGLATARHVAGKDG